MMSAPAAASASAIARPIPRRAPVTSASLTGREVEAASCLRPRSRSRIFSAVAGFQRVERLGHAVERHDRGDQRRRSGSRPSASRRTAVSKSTRLVDTGAEQRQFPPEDAEAGRPRAARGGSPTTTSAPAGAEASTAVATPAAVPETSNATSAPAPSVQSLDPSRGVGCRRVDGGQAERLDDCAPAYGSGSKTTTWAPARRATIAMSRPIGPAADDDGCSPGGEPRAPHVVHRDRHRLGERGVLSDRPRGRRTSEVSRHVPGDCMEPGRVDPQEDRAGGRCG